MANLRSLGHGPGAEVDAELQALVADLIALALGSEISIQNSKTELGLALASRLQLAKRFNKCPALRTQVKIKGGICRALSFAAAHSFFPHFQNFGNIDIWGGRG